MKRISFFLYTVCCTLALTSCTTLFGDKKDAQVDDVFEQGAIDPALVPQNVGCVPVFPFFQGFSHPVDVFVGYDELIYVVDDNGLNILDQKGTKYRTIPIPGATDVTQDRRLHTYVTGMVYDANSGYHLPAVFHLKGTAEDHIVFVDTLIHPYCDDSHQSSGYKVYPEDAQVRFTGLATLYDNTLYVARTGPKNNVNSTVRPDNGVLIYDQNGVNIANAAGLNPVSSSLKSALGLSSIATLAVPPQRQSGISTSKFFTMTQADQSQNIEYRVLGITVYDDPDAGTIYAETPSLLNFDVMKGDRFMYEPYRFKKPEDCYIAFDNLNYTYVVDSETDSLYIFNSLGIEGVNPPANSGLRKQVIVSFGGKDKDGRSDGPFSFNDPSGVCTFRRTIYVADKNNNRICRYKLSTDLQ